MHFSKSIGTLLNLSQYFFIYYLPIWSIINLQSDFFQHPLVFSNFNYFLRIENHTFNIISRKNYKIIFGSMAQEDDGIPKLKLIALGASGVGKSSILTRFANDKFDDFSEPTLGAAFIPKKFTLPDNRIVQFHLWDTAGQQKYKSIAPIYYRQAKIALCVYDICSQKSFQVMKNWIEQLRTSGPPDIILAIVGNKIDRYDEEQVVYADVKEYATQVGAILKLVSAKEGKNIQDLFTSVAQMGLGQNKQAGKKESGEKIKNGKEDKKGKKKCC